MKMPGTKTAGIFFLFALTAVLCLLTSACFVSLDYHEGTSISINLGGSPARNTFVNNSSYSLILTGPEGMLITEHLTGRGYVNVQVVPGRWDITVNALDKGVEFALGTASVYVEYGQNHNVTVQMKFIVDDAVLAYLTAAENGVTPDDPVSLHLAMELNSAAWLGVLQAIEDTGKYINLNLADCTPSDAAVNGGLQSNGTFDLESTVDTGKDKIMSLVLPDAALEIDTLYPNAFRYFSSLEHVSAANVTSIGDYAFSSRYNLISVDFPQVTDIGEFAFFQCTSLTNISFPVAVNIGYSAFDTCNSLTSVSFPEVISIAGSAFMLCTNLTSVDFPMVTSIAGGAFASCTSLTGVSFPTVSSIGGGAFNYCTSLTTISFPAAADITGNPFSGSASLISIYLIGAGNLSVIENGRALVRNSTELVSYPTATGSITFDTITSIGDNAMSGTGVISVSFPAVTSIGDWAFSSCISLETVNFPLVTNIGESAFVVCTNLINIYFPAATTIGDSAFSGCISLESVDFPLVTNIGESAFRVCTSLTSINFPVTTSIGEAAFGGCTSLESVDFPMTTSIGEGAFGGCIKLTNISFPLAINIENSAFSRCTSLTSVSFPSVTTIGWGAFYDCTNLESVNFPKVNTIDTSAFSGCNNLSSITIRENVIGIESAFFPYHFLTAYIDNNRRAGAYILHNGTWDHMLSRITLNFDAGLGAFSENSFAVSRSSANGLDIEQTIEITGEGYTNPRWRVDNVLAGTGDSITINALNYFIGNHSLSLWVVYNGSDWSRELSFTVEE